MKPEDQKEETIESTFSPAELHQMLSDKQIELNQALEDILKVKNELLNLTVRSLKVHEENQMYKDAPELAAQMAKLEFEMKIAERFVQSGAFKCKNAEEAYVKIKAGAEMGMKPVESMQSLCIINGQIDFFGDGRSSRILDAGFRIEYLNESDDQVTVKVHNNHLKGVLPDHEIIEVQETAKASDQILQKSQAMKFGKKNKMRWHGLGMIASFHLPHLFKSVADQFTSEFLESKAQIPERTSKNFQLQQDTDEVSRCLNWIETADTLDKLLQVKEDAKQFLLIDAYELAEQNLMTDAK